MSKYKSQLYSIGYATKPIEQFISQLQAYNIDVVVDVRSVPFSKVFFNYHQQNIKAFLMQSAIQYVYLGEELGPRSKDDNHYNTEKQVQFNCLMLSDIFLSGIQRLLNGLQKGYRIALMCAEKDPAECHRSLLLGHYLKHQCDIILQHIRHDGKLECESSLEHRLMHENNLAPDMLMDENECLVRAYEAQKKKVAYIKS